MKRSILIAVAAVALGAPLAQALPAVEAYRGRDDYRERDREGHRGDREDYHGGDDYRGRGYDRGHEDHRVRARRFVVHYHLDGGRGRVQAKSHDRAHRMEDFLRSIGADARVGPGRVVYFRMRGEGKTFRYSHEDAHRLAQKLEGYGFHAHVDHE